MMARVAARGSMRSAGRSNRDPSRAIARVSPGPAAFLEACRLDVSRAQARQRQPRLARPRHGCRLLHAQRSAPRQDRCSPAARRRARASRRPSRRASPPQAATPISASCCCALPSRRPSKGRRRRRPPLDCRPARRSFASRSCRCWNRSTSTMRGRPFARSRTRHPGGLGRVEREDVHQPPSLDLRSAMALAADRDSIARQYDNGFADLFELGAAGLRHACRASSRSACGSRRCSEPT